VTDVQRLTRKTEQQTYKGTVEDVPCLVRLFVNCLSVESVCELPLN